MANIHLKNSSMPRYVGAKASVTRTEDGIRISMSDYQGVTEETIVEAIDSITTNADGSLTFALPDGREIVTGSLKGAPGAYCGETEPTDPDVLVWVDPSNEGGSVLKLKENGEWTPVTTIIGEAAGFGTVSASVDSNHGTPSVTVTATGDDTAKDFTFEFKNLQPAPYDDSVIQARMDSFTQLPTGSTAGDAELIDGRVGADGVTYTNIGGAIRGQITDLKSEINDITEPTKNIYNCNDNGLVLNGLYVSSGGAVGESATATSIYCPCEPSTTYTVSKNVTSRFRVADFASAPQNGSSSVSAPIGSNAAESITFTTGATANYLMVYLFDSANDTNLQQVLKSVQIEKGNQKTDYEPYRTAVDIVARNRIINTNGLADNSVTPYKISFVKHDPNTSYIPEFIEGKYIKADGTEGESGTLSATGWVQLEENTNYYYEYLVEGYYAFYDEDREYIIGYPNNTPLANPFQIPAGAKYARFTINSNPINPNYYPWIFTSNTEPDKCGFILSDTIKVASEDNNRCDYKGSEFSVFNKCLCIGDSLTEGVFNHRDSGSTQYESYPNYAYPKYLAKISGITVTNEGEASATADEWFSHHRNNDYSGYDVAIIQLGVNDVIRYTTFGATTQQAFEDIFTKLQSENNNIKIFVANIIPATSYSSADYVTFSNALLAWLETKNQSDSNIIPLDIQQYGHTADSSAYNCGHLSALGYQRLAQDYMSYISWYINENKSLFKEVQFIGTDYWFDNPNA